MIRLPHLFTCLAFCMLSVAAACSPAVGSAQRAPLATATPCAAPGEKGWQEICGFDEVLPTPTDLVEVGPLPPAQTAMPTEPVPTIAPPTLAPPPISASPTTPVVSLPCHSDLCTYSAPLFLARPIAPPGDSSPDITYRFGTTAGGTRDPHHGIEMLNRYGTSVLAAGAGVVKVAGDDVQPTSERGVWPITYYGPYSNFYGKLVIIEHTLPEALERELRQLFPDLRLPVYTLYAHLSEVSVEVGQQVETGQEIGKVGMTGIATGPHLHLEVRLGAETYTSYSSSHNPELWLAPKQDEDGQPMGALAGRFLNTLGENHQMSGVTLEYLPDGPQRPNSGVFPIITYEEKKLRGRPPFNEGFGFTDLRPGWYRINYPNNGLKSVLFEILPGQLTVVTIRLQ
jgi:murein DD-endopeptidase MepM/ murein hydrolase activator NlpD